MLNVPIRRGFWVQNMDIPEARGAAMYGNCDEPSIQSVAIAFANDGPSPKYSAAATAKAKTAKMTSAPSWDVIMDLRARLTSPAT